jgi:hypothetical protein
MPDLQTSRVGRFNVSDQFFLAHHAAHSKDCASGDCEYAALYCFDRNGTLTTHKIIGPLKTATDDTMRQLLAELGPYEFGDIFVAPFQVTFDGQVFGLVPDSEGGTITLQPGSMITFMEPWDGEYYT